MSLEFGALLRHFRQASGQSLRSVARDIGVSPAYLSQVETGKEAVPAPERLEQLEKILDLEPGVLTALTDRVDPRVLNVLRQHPAAAEVLLAADKAGFDEGDFLQLAARIRSGAGGVPQTDANGAVDTAADEPIALTPFLHADRCLAGLTVRDRASLFARVVDAIPGMLKVIDAPTAITLLDEREHAATTAIGNGVALPHAFVPGLEHPLLAVATMPEGVPFEDRGHIPVTLAFFVFSPKPPGHVHVRLLARIAWLCRDGAACDALRAAPTGHALYARLRAFDRRG